MLTTTARLSNLLKKGSEVLENGLKIASEAAFVGELAAGAVVLKGVAKTALQCGGALVLDAINMPFADYACTGANLSRNVQESLPEIKQALLFGALLWTAVRVGQHRAAHFCSLQQDENYPALRH